MKNAQITHPIAPLKIKHNTARSRLKSEIVFGSLSTGCKGSGVCKVVPSDTMTTDWKCPHATAWISVTANNRLRFAFIKSSMSEQMIRRYFRWQLFQVFEPYTMPVFIEKKMKLNRKMTIAPGIYVVRETTIELIVDFNII